MSVPRRTLRRKLATFFHCVRRARSLLLLNILSLLLLSSRSTSHVPSSEKVNQCTARPAKDGPSVEICLIPAHRINPETFSANHILQPCPAINRTVKRLKIHGKRSLRSGQALPPALPVTNSQILRRLSSPIHPNHNRAMAGQMGMDISLLRNNSLKKIWQL